MIARTCSANRPGDEQAEPHAAQAEHRVGLVQPLHGGEQPLVGLGPPCPAASASATLTASSVRSGRNSCSGGSSSRMVTGRPSIASSSSTKSCALQRQQRLQRRRLARPASLGEDDPLDQRAAVAEEHVLGAAQPDALRAQAAGPRGVLAGVGVGAHPEPARARRRG